MSKTGRKPLPGARRGHSSAWNTTKTIAWSFFGVRRRRDHEQEGATVSPIHVLVAGFAGVFMLVAGLIVLVNWVAA